MKIKTLLVLIFASIFVASVIGVVSAERVDYDCWIAVAVKQSIPAFAVETGRTLPDAQKAAMKAAGMPGAGIWSWRHGGCITVAVDQDNPKVTFGMRGGDTLDEAVKAAEDYCSETKKPNCKIILKKCCNAESKNLPRRR